MSGFTSERSAIEVRFAQQWVVGSPSAPRTPVGYHAHSFTPVSNSVRLTIRDGDGMQKSIGNPGGNVARYAGAVMLEFYTEGGKGSAASRVLEDAASAIFMNAYFDGIDCGIPYISGEREEHPFFVRTMVVPYTRDVLNA